MLKVQKNLERKVADTVIWSVDEALGDNGAGCMYWLHSKNKRERVDILHIQWLGNKLEQTVTQTLNYFQQKETQIFRDPKSLLRSNSQIYTWLPKKP